MNEYMLCCGEGTCSGVGLEILTERHVSSFVVLAFPCILRKFDIYHSLTFALSRSLV